MKLANVLLHPFKSVFALFVEREQLLRENARLKKEQLKPGCYVEFNEYEKANRGYHRMKKKAFLYRNATMNLSGYVKMQHLIIQDLEEQLRNQYKTAQQYQDCTIVLTCYARMMRHTMKAIEDTLAAKSLKGVKAGKAIHEAMLHAFKLATAAQHAQGCMIEQ